MEISLSFPLCRGSPLANVKAVPAASSMRQRRPIGHEARFNYLLETRSKPLLSVESFT